MGPPHPPRLRFPRAAQPATGSCRAPGRSARYRSGAQRPTRLHLGDEAVQRWHAIQQVVLGLVVGVADHGQLATGELAFPGPPNLVKSAFDRLEPRSRRRSRRARHSGEGGGAGRAEHGDGPGRARARSAAPPGSTRRPWRGSGRSRPPAGPTALSRRAAVSSVGSVMSGRARSSAASVWSSHRYRWSNWWSSSTASRSAAGTVMPSSRSDSMPRPIASTNGSGG